LQGREHFLLEVEDIPAISPFAHRIGKVSQTSSVEYLRLAALSKKQGISCRIDLETRGPRVRRIP
jgi:hypothetical protein